MVIRVATVVRVGFSFTAVDGSVSWLTVLFFDNRAVTMRTLREEKTRLLGRHDLLPKAVGSGPVACPPTSKGGGIGTRNATSKAIVHHVLTRPAIRSPGCSHTCRTQGLDSPISTWGSGRPFPRSIFFLCAMACGV
jgi:hypothetical protein